MPQPEAIDFREVVAADRATIFSPTCALCRHQQGPRKCAAFDKLQIPVTIWRGDDPHTTPWPGDRGLRFDPIPHEAEP